MGYRWEVLAWVNLGDGYRDHVQYQGQSLIGALRAYWEARRNGVGCIRVVWRG
ncbi:hypothetical protein SEA_AXYM_37 [Gordonia phage Axym]|uniref:Uncharacterized protein n=3 Tax=Emalynvirus cozz TaxID=2560490 RepID=A0A5Q2WGA7_9CAUD|nr:hypothetical protein BH767_gp36 [Gordonia phage Cozz]AZS11791.1 hypothetical protein PBI_NINA_37 [Gordonia phage Nina]QDM56315.1 hypothetical protein SEA_SWEATNTEARS_39 [Gordonia phage SweatNTears]QGH75904.1 hypothetical protein SEA_AXYM_37 [Gordonia phage Axym]QGH76666.1 hypothetical protein PBI_QUASAR_38 [Gordonia phage Quasar]ANA85742.1 hypothetical protein PBI_COZZ_36 [Gordonia phage Cozz]